MLNLNAGTYINTLEVVSSSSLGAFAYLIAKQLSPTMPLGMRIGIALVVAIFSWGLFRFWRQNAALQVVASIENFNGVNSNQIDIEEKPSIELPQDGILIDVTN